LPADLDVAIVGAGPYGLSLAAYLSALSVRYRIFGEPMQTWRSHMPKGMALKSDPFASCLYDPASRFTLEAFCRERGLAYAPTGWQVPLETFVEYGCWFQERTIPDLDRSAIQHIDTEGEGFRLAVGSGESVLAKRVVLCVGISHFARLPRELQHIPPNLLSHSSQHADPSLFAGRDVTILGAGASALDLAMLMHEGGAKVRLVARAPMAKFGSGGAGSRPLLAQVLRPRSGLGAGWSTYLLSHFPGPFRFLPSEARTWLVRRVLGPAAGWGVRERVEGKVPFLLNHQITRIEPSGDHLILHLRGPEGDTNISTDHLIAATGYRPDISKLAFLSADLQRRIALVDGSPRLGGAFQSSVRNLFFAGLAAANTFGPLQRFAFGARFAAARISRALSNG
jgi:FAD-dependent urate hydroxylase